MRRNILLLIVVSAFVWSCGHEGTGPLGPVATGITKLAGPETDTAAARPIQALTVQVGAPGGAPAKGVVVRFESLVSFSSPVRAFVNMTALTSNQASSLVALQADNEGKASVLVLIGHIAGEARMLVSVPELGYQDTLRFTIVPGAPSKVSFTVRDTALLLGATWSPAPYVSDQFGNRRTESAILAVSTPSTCSLNGVQVTAGALGGCIVTGTYQQAKDTARADVVLPYKLAVVSGHALSTVNADGSDYQLILQTRDESLAPDWAPDGQSIVIYEGGPFDDAKLSIVNLNGVRVKQVGGHDASFATAYFGRFSKDGQWVYFSAVANGQSSLLIWRMRPDGTGMESVLTPTTDVPVGQRPSVSPDGQTVVFDLGNQLAVLDVATKQPTLLNVPGVTPAFSPDGQTIAYVGRATQGLFLVNRDGTNVRQLLPQRFYEWQSPEWTPDGQWVLAREDAGGLIFVNIQDKSIVTPRRGGIQGALKP